MAEKKGDIKGKDENLKNDKGKKNQHFQIRWLRYMIKIVEIKKQICLWH